MTSPLSFFSSAVYRCLTSANRVSRFVLPARTGSRILMYHAVGTKIEDDRKGIYTISPARFEAHMRILATQFGGSVKMLTAPPWSGTGVMVTFDDGYQDNLTQAYPVLARLGIPCTVFVTTGPVFARQPGFLSPEELRRLDSLEGVSIGAHGATHVPLARCGDRQLREELTGSKARLEDLLGHSIDALSYPHGSVDRRVRDAAGEAGFRIGATSRFDINPPGRDPLLLCRTDIWSNDSDAVFLEKLAGHWDWRRWRRADPAAGPAMVPHG